MSTPPVKILLVEDSLSDAALLQESLVESGAGQYEFTHTETLADGLEYLGREPFDVLLLDLNLPDSVGHETFRRARARAPGVPIVVLTGTDNEALGLEALRGGVQDYLTKHHSDGRQVAQAIRYAIERKRADAALRASEAQFRAIFEVASVGITQADPATGRLLRFNEKYCKITGYSPEELWDLTFQDLTHPDDRARDWELFSRAARDATGTYRNEKRYVCKDGTVIWVRLNAAFVRNADGQAIQSVAVCEDISERKATEQKLRENQDRLLLAQKAGHVGVFELDFQANQRYWSDERKSLFGVPPTFEPKEGSWSSLVHKADCAAARNQLQRTFGQRRREVEQTYRITRPDGQEQWVEDRGLITYDGDGRPIRMVGSSRDITVEVEARERARQRQRQFRYSALRTVIVLTISLVVVDAGIMLALTRMPSIGPWSSILVDSVGLVLLVSPALYFFAFRPLAEILQQRDEVEEALRRANETLELRVTDRTASLELANRNLEAEMVERRKAERALRESQEDLNHAQEVAHVGSWRLNVQRNELRWSEENWRIFGVAPGTPLTYETFLGAVHPEDREYVDRRWQAALRGERYDIEHRIVVGDQVKWVRERAVVERDSQGALLGGFGTTQDITEKKQVETALAQVYAELERRVDERTAKLKELNARLQSEIQVRREAEQVIREAEFRYRTVADFTHDWEYWQGPQGGLIYCSPSCERITGYTAEELTADRELLRRIILPEDRPIWDEHEASAPAQEVRRPIQFRIRHRDGGVRWIDHNCRRVTGDRGEFLGIRGGNRDVTDRKRAEAEQQQLRDELARVSRITTTGQLAASLAHELNQPLGAIVCNTQAAQNLLARDGLDKSEILEVLQDVEAESKRAGEVIHQLRSLYQKTGGVRTELQINRIVQRTMNLLNSELVFKDVALRLELDEQLPRVRGSEVELQQVVLNLVTNALEAMASGPAAARRLLIRTAGDGARNICVSVRDSGPGLTEAQLCRVFEPLFTTKATGMGMGLAISHSIIEAHGGRLWAENNPEAGATFHFTVPVNSANP